MSGEPSNELQSKLPNADMQAAPQALLRAARRAREIAFQTNTAIVVVIDGLLIEQRVTESDHRSRVAPVNVVHTD